MRRRNLLITLLVLVCIWAYSVRDASDVFAIEGSVIEIAQSEMVSNPADVNTEDIQTPVAAPSNIATEVIDEVDDTVESIALVQPARLTTSEPYADMQWALEKIEIATLWQLTTGNPDITVAVLDTGIDSKHQDLSGQVVAEHNFTDTSNSGDVHGHGTHIAGIIAAKDNGVGIIGIAPDVSLINVKVADDIGTCSLSDLAKGIVWAVDNGADVINISIEIRESLPQLESAISYAWRNGALIIAAAGNDGSETPVYPASYDNCLAVAALSENDNLVMLSNYGNWVDVVAPGDDIYSTLPGDEYGYKSGTSFACAYVSGMAALLYDVVVDANDNGRINDEVRALIESGCSDVNINGAGNGQIDAVKTLSLFTAS